MPAPEHAPIMVVAGEASGDLHGATLCRALRTLAPARRLIGMGGDRMAAAGLERLADVTAAAALGATEAVGPIPNPLAAAAGPESGLAGPPRPAAARATGVPERELPLGRAAGPARL